MMDAILIGHVMLPWQSQMRKQYHIPEKKEVLANNIHKQQEHILQHGNISNNHPYLFQATQS